MSQDVIDAQQAQIQKLLQRLNELNRDHEALLLEYQQHKKETKSASSKPKLKSSAFGRLKQKLLTPKNASFKPVDQHNVMTDDLDSGSELDRETQLELGSGADAMSHSHHVDTNTNSNTECVVPATRSFDSKQTQTQRIKCTNTPQQTDRDLLRDENNKLRRDYADIRQLYEKLLHSHSDSASTLDIRDGQLRDLAMERNQLGKELQTVKKQNVNLMRVLEMKSKQTLDPDRDRNSPSQSYVSSVSNMSQLSLNDTTTTSLGDLEVATKESDEARNSKSKPRRNSGSFMKIPVKTVFGGNMNVQSLFKPMVSAPSKRKGVTKDSMDLANKLMKEIQDKDEEIATLRAQLQLAPNVNCKNDR